MKSSPTRARVAWIAAAAAGLMVAAFAPDAAAFERTKTCNSYGTYECKPGENPKPIEWPVRCVKYRINEDGSEQFGSTDGKISDRLKNLVEQAFQSWNDPDCAGFAMVNGGLTSNDRARYKQNQGIEGNMNLVVWRDDSWPYQRSRAAFALTSVTYDSNEAVITDADIEINSANYDFAHLQKSQVGSDNAKVDLLNTLTHEVGHFVGLDHPNNPDATMYGKAPPGEIQKRNLSQDDVRGLCTIYPTRDQNVSCRFDEDFVPSDDAQDPDADAPRICSMGAPASSRLLILLAWLGLLAGTRFRRTRPRR